MSVEPPASQPPPRRQEQPAPLYVREDAPREATAVAAQTSTRAPSIRQAVFGKEGAGKGGEATASGEQDAPGTSLKTLRDRLIQRQQR
jgi:hypothetical protein